MEKEKWDYLTKIVCLPLICAYAVLPIGNARAQTTGGPQQGLSPDLHTKLYNKTGKEVDLSVATYCNITLPDPKTGKFNPISIHEAIDLKGNDKDRLEFEGVLADVKILTSGTKVNINYTINNGEKTSGLELLKDSYFTYADPFGVGQGTNGVIISSPGKDKFVGRNGNQVDYDKDDNRIITIYDLKYQGNDGMYVGESDLLGRVDSKSSGSIAISAPQFLASSRLTYKVFDDRASNLAHRAEKALKDMVGKIDSAQKQKVEAAIKDLRDSIKSDDGKNMQQKMNALTNVLHEISLKIDKSK